MLMSKKTIMEPIVSLKRSTNVVLSMCIICQERKDDKIINGGQQGFQRLQDCATQRHKLKDVKNRSIIDRVHSNSSSKEPLVWHKSCYSWFTDKGKIARLDKYSLTSTPCCGSLEDSYPNLRSSTSRINWELCIFCQTLSTESLHSVSTFTTSKKILDAAQFDKVIGIALAGTSDLIAAEGKYHLKCYASFMKNTSRVRDTVKENDIAMTWLCKELEETAGKGYMLDMDEVWKRYCTLMRDTGKEVPQSFLSRRSSFKEKLRSLINEFFEFHVLSRNADCEKRTILVPKQFAHIAIDQIVASSHDSNTEVCKMTLFKPDDTFLSLVHVALRLRADILSHKPYVGMNISKDEAAASVPETLHMFMKVLYGGQEAFDEDIEEDEEENTCINNNAHFCDRALSVAQDIVFGVSGGKQLTPKHIGLGSTLHQATRSKHLVQMFHKAGHIISYKKILQLDTTLAETALHSMDPATGGICPSNFVEHRFLHFTADNIDIMDASLDGKDTFHGTQIAAWQRGPSPNCTTLLNLTLSQHDSLKVPGTLTSLIHSNVVEGVSKPPYGEQVQQLWYSPVQNLGHAEAKATAMEMAFLFKRNATTPKQGWTHFNQQHSEIEPHQTTIGYMPLILSPAHQLDTLNTVIQRCKYTAESLGQKYVVLTVDEALFCKLMDLKWTIPEYQEYLIVRLGGLHTAMNFMKAIGQHMQSTGLLDVWIESGLLGKKTAEHALCGKNYEKSIRAHKITSQAMWQILLPQFMEYLQQNNAELKHEIESADSEEEDNELIKTLSNQKFSEALAKFKQDDDHGPTFKLWYEYLEMVKVLLMFTRAQREGNWDLHICAFKQMLPYFHIYDHTNYAKWGIIYIAEMNRLPDEVLEEFRKGNFVVKISKSKYNQVDPDQSQEWLNGTGKRGGGIVGITKNVSALSRWALSFNLRSQIAADTKELYGLNFDDTMVHKETTKSRRKKDSEDEDKVKQVLETFGLFARDQMQGETLQNIATKDQATQEITQSLLNAREKGQTRVEEFVNERLIPVEGDRFSKQFRDPLHKNKALTFSNLYDIPRRSDQKGKTLKADRSVLQRLLIAYEAGRKVDLESILQHELLPVPISIAEMDKSLRAGTKSILLDELTKNIVCPATIMIPGDATIIIDGQALLVSLGKPQNATTFGDLAQIFIQSIYKSGAMYTRIDVLFDRYEQLSIKSGTRSRRQKGTPIRRKIETPDVPLPQDWDGFLSNVENKADLARFLSEELVRTAQPGKTIVVAGGFTETTKVTSNNPDIDIGQLEGIQEEADTRIVLHCVKGSSDTIVVSARGTDVFVLLIAHYRTMPCTNLWLKFGTYKKPKFVNIKDVMAANHLDDVSAKLLLPFHALTGCDTTSYLSGHSKKTALKTFIQKKELLQGLGQEPLTEDTMKNVESFICHVYNVPNVEKTDKARLILF